MHEKLTNNELKSLRSLNHKLKSLQDKLFMALVFLVVINLIGVEYLKNKLYEWSIDRNKLVLELKILNDNYLLCKSFSINTTYFEISECEAIKSEIKNIKTQINNDFKLLEFYIKMKGIKVNE